MSLARFAFAPRFPTFFRDVDELFEVPASGTQQRTFTPAADVYETEKTVELHLDMPGIAPDAIDVKLEGDQLTISAERKTEKEAGKENEKFTRRERFAGTFRRTFTLSDTLEGTTPEASYKHGVLVVTLPKREAAQPRSFKVKVEA